MNPSLQIGPLSLHFYGLILGIAILVAVATAKVQAKRENFPQGIVDDAAIFLIIPVILGARAYHVLDYWEYYSKNISQIFFIWQGGIGIIGAILAGIVTILLYSKWRQVNFLKLTDIAAPAVAAGQSIGRIGNFLNSEGFGPPTNLPWGVFIPESVRPANWANFTHFHPTFFYEAAGDFLIFLTLFLLPTKKTGVKFSLYLILYSVLRFSLEFLRFDTWQLGILKVAQLISLVGVFAGLVVFSKVTRLAWTLKFST